MKKLGEILLEAGLITSDQFDKVLAELKTKKKRFGELVVEMGFSNEVEIAKALSTQLGYTFVDLSKIHAAPEALAVIDEEMAKEDVIFPYAILEDSLHIAMADPLSFSIIDDVRFKSGFKVVPVIATTSDILAAIEKHYSLVDSLDTVVTGLGSPDFLEVMPTAEAPKDVRELKKKGEAPPIVRTVNAIISNAIKCRASDIHIEPRKTKLIVRNRIDGLLRKVLELPKWVHASVVSRIKIMADLDISEKRHPQDGRIRVRSTNFEVDLRVSTLPTRFGEKVEIRLLNSQSAFKPMEEVGLSEKDYKRIKSIIGKPQGVTLVTGPTGSGKSTTLYAFLHHVKSENINIITLEDPVEYEVEDISQVQVSEKVGFTFAQGLRSVLRQDPDVIMVGEMRDKETAEIAMRASLTGHLVFSTIHTNDAVSTIVRLVDMGIPHYLIASSLEAVVSQRLARMICQECKETYSPSEIELQRLAEFIEPSKGMKLFRGKGCDRCDGSGYFGRTAIFEILIMNRTLRDLISSGKDEEAIEEAARKSGMTLLWEDAVRKMLEGATTLEEVERVVHRKEEHIFVCSSCGRKGKEEFHICPYCGQLRRDKCPKCDRHLEKEWHFCPYCNYSLEGAEAKKKPEAAKPPQHQPSIKSKKTPENAENRLDRPPAEKRPPKAVNIPKRRPIEKKESTFRIEKPVLLIAEGDRGIRSRLEKLLEKRMSCDLLSVLDGNKLVAEIEKKVPDLIIIDNNLPDAKETIETLRSTGIAKGAPLLFIHDKGDVVGKVKLLKSGVDDILEKPFSDEAFIDKIGFLWEGDSIVGLDDGLKA